MWQVVIGKWNWTKNLAVAYYFCHTHRSIQMATPPIWHLGCPRSISNLGRAIAGLQGVATILGDMPRLIWGEGEANQEAKIDHDRSLHALLMRCTKVGIKLSEKKIRFKSCVSEPQFVCKWTTERSCKGFSDHTHACSQDKTELHLFLSMANYLAKFRPKRSDVCAPLRELLQDKHEWCWTDTQ